MALLTSTQLAVAQDETPLLIAQGGYVSKLLSPTEIQTEQWCTSDIPPNDFAEFAPDGSAIVYRVRSPIWEETMRRTNIPASQAITDIIICQATIEIDMVFPQPEDASLLVPEVDDVYIERSTVTWSPDSSQVAWIETFAEQENMPELVIVTIATGEINRYSFPNIIQTQPTYPPPILWTNTGFVAQGFRHNETFFILFDPLTGDSQTVSLPNELFSQSVNFVVPIISDDIDTMLIAFHVIGDGWYILDFENDDTMRLATEQAIEKIHINNPNGMGIIYAEVEDRGMGIWFVRERDTSSLVQTDPILPPDFPTFSRQATISEDSSIAWHQDDTIIVINLGVQPFFIEEFSSQGLSLWWGTSAYRLVRWEQ